MTTNLEQSFKAKIRAIASEKRQSTASLWQTLMLERFLVRLARSEYSGYFVFKGGLLLSKYIEIGRETVDLDFLARNVTNKIDEIMSIFTEIANIDLNDGFSFKDIKVKELSHPRMQYAGVEVSMMAFFGRTRFKVDIDVGYGDIVEPAKNVVPLISSSKGSLFEESVTLDCYPKEFIFAEKLETVASLGAFSSRMKDLHDLLSLIASTDSHAFQNLEEIVRLVFEHRETRLVFPLFEQCSENDIDRMQHYWNEYLAGLQLENARVLPKQIVDIISKINAWLSVSINKVHSNN